MNGNISVLSCFYNRNQYIDAVLETIDAQTLKPAEIVIVDDGSDPPLEVPEREDIRLIRLDANGGLANARNVGVAAAMFPLIALLDSDDTWEPSKLEKQYEIMSKADENVFGVFVNYRRHGREQQEGSSFRQGIVKTPQVDDWYRFFLMGIRHGGGSTLMFRKEAYLKVGGIDTQLLRYEDWDFFLSATEIGDVRFLTIDEPLANVLLSGRPDAGKALAALEVIEERHMPRITDSGLRRLFRASIAFERAACARWQGKKSKMFFYLLKSLLSPALVKRELELSFTRS